jgi:hypothetical protein
VDLRYLPENERYVFDPDQSDATLTFTQGHRSQAAPGRAESDALAGLGTVVGNFAALATTVLKMGDETRRTSLIIVGTGGANS